GQLLDRPGAIFFPALQHSGDRRLWCAEPFHECAAVWPMALRCDRCDLGVPLHLYVLDDPEKSDRLERSGHLLLAGRDLLDEPPAAKRDAHSCLAAHYVCRVWRGFGDESRQLRAMACRAFPRALAIPVATALRPVRCANESTRVTAHSAVATDS